MYKKKEIIILFVIIIGLFIFGFYKTTKSAEVEIIEQSNKSIVITIDGEIARKTTLNFQNQTTYGTVLLRVKNLLNEYSDLSNFDLYEVIYTSMHVNIPTKDKNNQFDNSKFININTATQKELMCLPQIGEKRSEKIIEYIKNNGKIKTWDEFFKIVSVKDEYKEQIKKQAIL